MPNPTIIIESSARHVHVTKDDLAKLFGAGYALTNKRALSQPGQYLTEEKVRLEGPKGAIDRVSILGPERPITQVEISLTDARVLGVSAPIRESGDIAGSAPMRLVGPAGSVDIPEGCIVAKRHLHITPEDAAAFGVSDKEIIDVKVGGERGMTFSEVVVRVSDKFATSMHIDYDEANGAALGPDATGILVRK